jgi:hypothetical protein
MIVSQHATNSTVKLFRNTDQRIDLLLKDWDRRPVKLEEWERVFIKIFDGTREVKEKEADLIDFDRGWYVIDLTHDETGFFALGQYTYCVVIKQYDEATGNTTVEQTRMLWTNQDYGSQAPLKVLEGPLPQQPEALTVAIPNTILSGFYATSALKGAMQVRNLTGVHSIVIVLDEYVGDVLVEATLDPDVPATDQDWTLVSTTSYAAPADGDTATTGTQHISVTGNYHWLRLKFTSTTGLTGITYRNV